MKEDLTFDIQFVPTDELQELPSLNTDMREEKGKIISKGRNVQV